MRTKGVYRCWLAAIAFASLAACSNGRGSLSEAATAPVNEGPPTPSPPPESPPPVPPVPPPAPPEPPPEPPPQPPSEPPPGPPPETSTTSALAGYWLGNAVERDSERSREAVALIDHRGEAQLMVLTADSDDDDDDNDDDGDRGDFVLYGNLCCAASFDDKIAGKRVGDRHNEEGKVEIALAGGSLTGEIEFRKDRYTVHLTPSAEYDRSLTLQDLAGVYARTTSLFQTTMTLTIDANGRLTGSNANGCTFDGVVSISNPERNMVRLQVQMSSCGSSAFSEKQWNGSYDGLGLLLRNAVSTSNASVRQDVFYHSVIGPTWLGPQSVER